MLAVITAGVVRVNLWIGCGVGFFLLVVLNVAQVQALVFGRWLDAEKHPHALIHVAPVVLIGTLILIAGGITAGGRASISALRSPTSTTDHDRAAAALCV